MTSASLIGIPCGLGAAVVQSFAFIASRHFTASRDRRAGVALLVLMHLWLGGMALITLPLVWTAGVPWAAVAWPLILIAAFNVCGQIAITIALRLAEPSRVSPLLTIKVLVPALLTMLLGAPIGQGAYQSLTPWQWLAVGLCMAAGVSISRGGGGMKKSAIVAIAMTLLIFSGSDWCVGVTIGRMVATPGITPLRASLLTVSSLYILTMFAGLAALPTRWGGSSPDRWTFAWADWRDAFPYAACWYGAMILLFVAVGEVGLVLGIILQATRSFITIGLGTALMYMGMAHIEPKQPPRVVAVRIASGLLMFGAITLYVLGRPPATASLPLPPLLPPQAMK